MERIIDVKFNNEDRVAIVTTEDGFDETFTYYDLKENWAFGVATGWYGFEPFEEWVFHNYEDYEEYMRGYNKAVEDKKVA